MADDTIQVRVQIKGVRTFERTIRQVAVQLAPTWLGDLAWHFPTWAVRNRPFDYTVDEADIPAPTPPPSWSVPERQQFDLYLRPAEKVVQQ